MLRALEERGAAAFSLFWGAAASLALACDVYSSAKTLRDLGLCVAFARQPKAAEIYFQLALDVNRSPKSRAKTFCKMAQVRDANRQFDDAEEYYLRALEVATPPSVSHILAYLDFLSTSRGNLHWATKFYEAVIRVSPNHCQSLYNYGICLASSDLNAGIEMLFKALACATDAYEYCFVSQTLQHKLKQARRPEDADEQFKSMQKVLDETGLGHPHSAPDLRGAAAFLFVSHSAGALACLNAYMGGDKQQIHQVAINHAFSANLSERSPYDAVVEKANIIADLVKYSCVCEVSYIKIGDNSETVLSETEFEDMDKEELVRNYAGQRAVLGVAVAHHNQIRCRVYESTVSGKISSVRIKRPIKCSVWLMYFQLDGFEPLTMAEIPAQMRPFLSFRRKAYLQLLTELKEDDVDEKLL